MKNIQTIVVLFCFILLCSCGNRNSKEDVVERKNHPNVLFIAVDDLNTCLGCLSGFSNTKTPNIDRLAKRGVLFSNAHCQAPLCGPSRASIMSGLRPSTTGIYGMTHDDNIRRPDNEATKDIIFLPEYFKQQGYHTMGIGKLFHSHAPKGIFDESGGREKAFGPYPKKRFVWEGNAHVPGKHYGRTNTDWGAFPKSDTLMPDHRSSNWTIDKLQKDYDKPFFLAVGYQRPHVPLYVPQKWFDLHPLESIKTTPYKEDDLDDVPPVALKINDLPMMPCTRWAKESGEWKKIIQAYLACVSFVDNEIGRVLDALESSPYANNTVIVLWSDHGYRLGEKGTFAKHALWEPATNAPLLFAGPDVPRNKKITSPAEMLSIYPTLVELCGLPRYDRNEGVSLAPTMNEKRSDSEAYAITTFGMNNHAVKTQQFRYIRYEDGGEELYDHQSDPNEFTNLASQSSYRNTITTLNGLLPKINHKWDELSSYSFQPYFVEQKARILEKEK